MIRQVVKEEDLDQDNNCQDPLITLAMCLMNPTVLLAFVGAPTVFLVYVDPRQVR